MILELVLESFLQGDSQIYTIDPNGIACGEVKLSCYAESLTGSCEFLPHRSEDRWLWMLGKHRPPTDQ
ncbi:hypothetical protein PQX77_003516 [Marasmius sp. AFHP31]|nr:hypothetical protein PQX77_003516 [Marasmius sp. AFHP31]